MPPTVSQFQQVGWDKSGNAVTSADATITFSGSKVMVRLDGPLTANESDARLVIQMTNITSGFTGDKGNSDLTIAIYETGEPASFNPGASATLSLQGKIGVNFYLDLDTTLPDYGNAYVKITYNHNSDSYNNNRNIDVVNVKDTEKRNGKYRFSVAMNPGQICDPIDIELYDEDDNKLWEKTGYTIKQYCDSKIAGSSDPKIVALCKAIINYGAAAQTYFGYNTENMANAGDLDYGTLSEAIIDATTTVSHGGVNVRINSATLLAQSDTTVRIYYTLSGGATLDDYKISLTKPSVTNMGYRTGTQSGRTYIDVYGIESTNLDEYFTLTLTSKTDASKVESLTYSPFCYLKSRVLDSYEDDLNLRAICRAMYAYAVAADNYFAY